eukprot:957879-Pyramimonas_sp.AAC.3
MESIRLNPKDGRVNKLLSWRANAEGAHALRRYVLRIFVPSAMTGGCTTSFCAHPSRYLPRFSGTGLRYAIHAAKPIEQTRQMTED